MYLYLSIIIMLPYTYIIIGLNARTSENVGELYCSKLVVLTSEFTAR